MAREITIDGTGVSEVTYKKGDIDNDPAFKLLGQVSNMHPNIDLSMWEMIGLTKADNISTFTDTIGLVFKGRPPENILKGYFIHPKSNFTDYYQLKIGLDRSNPVLKVYDLTLGLHPLPSLPDGVAILENQGIGLYLSDEKRSHLRDVYFTHDNYQIMASWAKSKDIKFPTFGDEKTENIIFGFGVTWNVETFKILKLKRYFFPKDPLLEDPFSK